VTFFSEFIRNESGATAIEYGLIAGLIGVVIIVAVKATGSKVAGSFNKISNAI
jgi:pilus assembly protein Flp/PilA